MSIYTSNNQLFRYTVDNNTSYQLTSEDYDIISSSFNKWDGIVSKNERFTDGYTIDVSFSVVNLGSGILGGAQVLTAYYFDTYVFGNAYTARGNIKINNSYISSLKISVRTDGKTALYHVLLHEIGHILGIGTFWNMTGSPVTSYDDNGETKYYYTGENALREYKSYLPTISHTIVGLPIEDNGGSGTQNVHPEEGEEGTASSNNRYINNFFHPGLDNELMSGWMESYPHSTPLSRISLGFLEDMGFNVDYNQVDNYEIILDQNYVSSIYSMSNWLDLSDNANTLKSSYFSGFVDIKGGNLRTRETTDHLMIAGDASFNQKVYIGGDISWNPNNLANNSIPISAVDSLIETSTFDFTIEKKPSNATGNFTNPLGATTFTKVNGDTINIDIIGDLASNSYSDITKTDIQEIIIGSNVTSIGFQAFRDATALQSVSIPDSVTSLNNEAFRNTALQSVTLPDSVTSLGNQIFLSCSALTSVTIGTGITSIPDGTFQNCPSLETVSIPDNVTSIASNAFNSSDLSTVYMSETTKNNLGLNFDTNQTFFGKTGVTITNILTLLNTITTTTITGGYYYKIGKFVYVTYPRLTIANLNSGSTCTLITVSLPFTAAQKSSVACMGAGISGTDQSTTSSDGIPTLSCSQGANKINTEFLNHNNVSAYNLLFDTENDYLDITFNYIAE